jgi:hypothetical protein
LSGIKQALEYLRSKVVADSFKDGVKSVTPHEIIFIDPNELRDPDMRVNIKKFRKLFENDPSAEGIKDIPDFFIELYITDRILKNGPFFDPNDYKGQRLNLVNMLADSIKGKEKFISAMTGVPAEKLRPVPGDDYLWNKAFGIHEGAHVNQPFQKNASIRIEMDMKLKADLEKKKPAMEFKDFMSGMNKAVAKNLRIDEKEAEKLLDENLPSYVRAVNSLLEKNKMSVKPSIKAHMREYVRTYELERERYSLWQEADSDKAVVSFFRGIGREDMVQAWIDYRALESANRNAGRPTHSHATSIFLKQDGPVVVTIAHVEAASKFEDEMNRGIAKELGIKNPRIKIVREKMMELLDKDPKKYIGTLDKLLAQGKIGSTPEVREYMQQYADAYRRQIVGMEPKPVIAPVDEIDCDFDLWSSAEPVGGKAVIVAGNATTPDRMHIDGVSASAFFARHAGAAQPSPIAEASPLHQQIPVNPRLPG